MRTTQLRKIRKVQLARHERRTLARNIFEHLYQAITGASLVPSSFARRAVANGLPPAELASAISAAKSAERLPDYLFTVCHKKSEQAVYWDDLGLKPRARDNYLDSTLWGIYTDLLSFDQARKMQVCSQYRQAYSKAAPHFTSPAMPAKINYLASTLDAYLRIPAELTGSELELEAGAMPCALILNDLAAPKEELHFAENALLSSGIATLSFDYPGTGDYGTQLPSSFDLKELANSIFFLLSAIPQIDPSRLILYGVGCGARMALFLALAFPDRFKCTVSISAPLEILTELDKLSSVFAREHFVSEVSARTALMDLATQTPIEEELSLLSMPLLVAGGGKDRIALAEDTQYIYEHASSSDKKLILCPGANHNLFDMMPSLRYEIAQWIKQRV